jgi:hypothetical protein
MGMLTGAFLQGAGQGLNVLGQSMQRDLDRQTDEALFEKRTRMLAEIQRENAKTMRQDQYADDDARFPVRMEQEGKLTAARGAAQTEAEVTRATDPRLIAAKEAEAAAQTERELKRLEALSTDPRATAAQKREAEQKAAQLREEVKIRGDGAIRVANATRAPSGPRAPTSDERVAEYTRVMGQPPSKEVELQIRGFTSGKKEGDGLQSFREKQAEEAATKAIDEDRIKPEDRAKFVRAQLRSYGEQDAVDAATEMLRTARGSGTVDEFIAARRRGGASDAALLQLGVTKDELKAAAPAKEGTKKRAGMIDMPDRPMTELARAERELMRYGSRQKQADPAGYERAKAAYERAKAAELAGLPAPTDADRRPSFRMAAP